MATVNSKFGRAGANLGSGQPRLSAVLVDLATDLDAIFTNFDALLAKLDSDAGVTDTDYASTLAVGNPNHQSE